MTDQVQICNMALMGIGANPISSLTEGGTEADLCSLFWEPVLKEVLADHKWNFAKKWVSLAEIDSYSFVDEEYSYAYQLPADYIRMSRLEDKDSQYEIRGSVLFCNLEEAICEYIYYEDDPTKLPPYFVTAFVIRLKAELSIPLSKKGSKTIDYIKLYSGMALPRAKTLDAQDTFPSQDSIYRHTEENDTWLNVRDS